MEAKDRLDEIGPRDRSQKLILVVDDDEFMRYNLNRYRRETKNIPVIFMSAFANDETMEEARKREAEYFLTEPFSNEQLRPLNDNILSRHNQE